MEYDLIIIGAGAAGLFTAANVPFGLKTLVIEKMDSPGKKLLLAGGGQCNFTNSEPVKNFLKRYGTNGKRLRPVLFPFSNLKLIDFFERNGLPVTVREDGKVFPASLKSSDVLDILVKLSEERGVTFLYQTAVTDISYREEMSGSKKFYVMANEEQFTSKYVLAATGGASYPLTGSDGSFFACLMRFGIDIVPPRPALSPVFVNNYPFHDLSGLTFPFSVIEVSRKNGGKPVKTEGSLLFTHKGFSGPAILELSRYVEAGDKLTINYLPGRSPDELRISFINAAAGDKKQTVNLLSSVTGLPNSFLDCVCVRSKIAKDVKASRLTGHDMGILAKHITADSYEISGTGSFSAAMATNGGVSLDEVELRTMEAKHHPGLFFAGEVLDVDGDTGGYNLQFAYSSAMIALRAMCSC